MTALSIDGYSIFWRVVDTGYSILEFGIWIWVHGSGFKPEERTPMSIMQSPPSDAVTYIRGGWMTDENCKTRNPKPLNPKPLNPKTLNHQTLKP